MYHPRLVSNLLLFKTFLEQEYCLYLLIIQYSYFIEVIVSLQTSRPVGRMTDRNYYTAKPTTEVGLVKRTETAPI